MPPAGLPFFLLGRKKENIYFGPATLQSVTSLPLLKNFGKHKQCIYILKPTLQSCCACFKFSKTETQEDTRNFHAGQRRASTPVTCCQQSAGLEPRSGKQTGTIPKTTHTHTPHTQTHLGVGDVTSSIDEQAHEAQCNGRLSRNLKLCMMSPSQNKSRVGRCFTTTCCHLPGVGRAPSPQNVCDASRH